MTTRWADHLPNMAGLAYERVGVSGGLPVQRLRRVRAGVLHRDHGSLHISSARLNYSPDGGHFLDRYVELFTEAEGDTYNEARSMAWAHSPNRWRDI